MLIRCRNKLKRNLFSGFLTVCSFYLYNNLFAGTIPDSLITDWSKAGVQGAIEYPYRIISIMDVGGQNDSSGNNSTRFSKCINGIERKSGNYLFPVRQVFCLQTR
jgi:hypothetical protein